MGKEKYRSVYKSSSYMREPGKGVVHIKVAPAVLPFG